MIRRSILTAVIAALTIGATLSTTACADATAPHNDCQITNGSMSCNGG